MLAGYTCERNPATGFPAFAFRLHQFISRGDTIYASLESEDQRYLTLNRQQFVPGDRKEVLLPLVFCRECGQEYYCVRRIEDRFRHGTTSPREFSDRSNDGDSRAGFLYYSAENPWPSGTEQEIVESARGLERRDTNQGYRAINGQRRRTCLDPSWQPLAEQVGTCNWPFLPEPFRFCLHCRVAYDFRTTSDFGKLTSLGTEGRSTATTILSLATIRHLPEGTDARSPLRASCSALPITARTLLCRLAISTISLRSVFSARLCLKACSERRFRRPQP